MRVCGDKACDVAFVALEIRACRVYVLDTATISASTKGLFPISDISEYFGGESVVRFDLIISLDQVLVTVTGAESAW